MIRSQSQHVNKVKLNSEYLEQVWTQHFVGHNDALDIVFCNNNYCTNTDGSLTSVELTLK